MAVQSKRSSNGRSHNRPDPDTARRSNGQARTDEPASDGYDAEEGALDTGLASQTIALADVLDNAEQDAESLSIDADDLGSHALRAATQQDGGTADRAREEESELADESTTAPGVVDLARNDIRNGSLFDQPRDDDPSEVRRPFVRSNEVDATLEQNERARRARGSKG